MDAFPITRSASAMAVRALFASLLAVLCDCRAASPEQAPATEPGAARAPELHRGASARVTPKRIGRRLALVVGTDAYDREEAWAPLLRPSKDAHEIATELVERYGFELVPVPSSPTLRQFDEALNAAKAAVGEDDDLLVFLAGHGHFDEEQGQGYLIHRDSPPGHECRFGGCYSLTAIRTLLETSKARHVLLIVDACHGGTIQEDIAIRSESSALPKRLLDDYATYRSRLVLTSGGNVRVSDDSKFARSLVDALRRPEDGVVAFGHMVGAVGKLTPTPVWGQFQGSRRHEPGGTFILAAVEQTPAPPPEPVRPAATGFEACRETYVQKRYREAAECFKRYVDGAPNADDAAQALYEAAQAYLDAKAVTQSLETLRLIIERHPRHELAPQAVYAIARMYQRTTAFHEAATWFEHLVKRYPEHELAQAALRRAAVLRKTLGQLTEAISALETHLERYPSDGSRPRVDLEVASLLGRQGKWQRVVERVRAHVERFADEPASVRLQVLNLLGTALQAMKKPREALAAFESTVAHFTGLPKETIRDLDLAGMAAAAESTFQIGEAQLEEARKVKLVRGPSDASQRSLTDKLTHLASAKQTYEQAIAMGHPAWVMASYTRLGAALQDLADDLDAVFPVDGLAGHSETRALFARHATDLRAHALASYRRTLQLAREFRWPSVHSEQAERAVALLDIEDPSVKEYRVRPTRLRANGAFPVLDAADGLDARRRLFVVGDPGDRFGQALRIAGDPKLRSFRAREAEALFGSVRSREAQHNLGLLLARRGDLDGARRAWRASIELDATYVPARAQLLGLDLADPARSAAALAELERIVSEDLFQQDAQNLLAAYKLGRAVAMMKSDPAKAAEELEGARRHARNVLVDDPDNVNAHLNIALSYYHAGRLDEAGLVTAHALEDLPDAPSIRNLSGLIRLARDEVRQATDDLMAALEADPSDEDARLNLAALELGYGDFESARRRLASVLASRPGDAEVRMSRGVALRGLGRFDEAEADYLAARAAGAREAEYNLCILHQQYTRKREAAKSHCASYLASISRTHPKFEEVTKRLASVGSSPLGVEP